MIIREIITSLTAAAMICSIIPSYPVTAVDETPAFTAAENDVFKYNIYSDHIELNGLKDGDDPVVIPAEIECKRTRRVRIHNIQTIGDRY